MSSRILRISISFSIRPAGDMVPLEAGIVVDKDGTTGDGVHRLEARFVIVGLMGAGET